MNPPVTPFDLERLFVGSEPWLFYAEILFRTAVIYIYAFVLIRAIGKRATGQFSTIELFLIVSLGSAVGDPMFYPQVPLLHTMAVITLIVAMNELLFFTVRKSETMDRIINLDPEQCVKDGVIVLDEKVLTSEEIFGMLRLSGIENLGQVRAAFLEKNGSLSVFKFAVPRAGLTIVPPVSCADNGKSSNVAQTTAVSGAEYACRHCGTVQKKRGTCSHCGASRWSKAERFVGDA
ncbi:MAG: DUF421 domain-containing protein [Alphaproteobacteria bacterium]|nr:DUF421 domain-containing protein [Alphaproteobacteria bacterium]